MQDIYVLNQQNVYENKSIHFQHRRAFCHFCRRLPKGKRRCLSKKAATMIYKSSVRFISRFIRRHQAPTTGFNLMPLATIDVCLLSSQLSYNFSLFPYSLSPNSAVPTLTIVAPSSMAISKSRVMPMERMSIFTLSKCFSVMV